MLANFKFNLTAIVITGLIVTASITAPFTKMFGKQYKESKDFSCCKKDQLVLHHYYTVHVFWIEVADGFTEENLGKAVPGGCNIHCSE
jgi:hypothetical protein